MTDRFVWLEELLRLAQTDRVAAQQCLQSATANRLARLLLALSPPEQLIAPMLLTIILPEQFEALDSLMQRITPAIDKQLQTAQRRLASQELEVKRAFQEALDAQANHSEKEVSTREHYFLQIAIRELRKGRVRETLSRKESALRIADAIASESPRRNAAE